MCLRPLLCSKRDFSHKETPKHLKKSSPCSLQLGKARVYHSQRTSTVKNTNKQTFFTKRAMISTICPFNQSGICPVTVLITLIELDMVSLLEQINRWPQIWADRFFSHTSGRKIRNRFHSHGTDIKTIYSQSYPRAMLFLVLSLII